MARNRRVPLSSAYGNTREDETRKKAWRAVKQFNSMLPAFNRFAQRMTGNPKMKVIASKEGAYTDGKTIWVAPPIELGDSTAHDRNVCDMRGPDMRQLCQACDGREIAVWSLYHEIAHIVGGSTIRPRPEDVDKILSMIDEWHPKGVCNHGASKKKQVALAPDPLNLVGCLNEYLPLFIKALEDARVDAGMLLVMPGLRVMFQARIRRIFESGLRRHDGTVDRWSEQPIDAQIVIGILLISSGYEVQPDYLREEARVILQDEELITLAHEARSLSNVHGTFDLTLRVWDRLQRMGLFEVPKCMATPSLNNDPGESSDDAANEPSETGDSGEGSDDPSSRSDGGAGHQSDPGSPSGSGGDGSPEFEDGEQSDSPGGGSNQEESSSDDSSEPGEIPDGDPNDDDGPEEGQNSGSHRDDSGNQGDASESETGGGTEGDPSTDEGDSGSDSEASDSGDPPGSGDHEAGESALGVTPDDGDHPEGSEADGDDSVESDSPVGTAGDSDPVDELEIDPSVEGADDHAGDDDDPYDTADEEVKGASVWDGDNPETLVEHLRGDPSTADSVKELLSEFMGHGEHVESRVPHQYNIDNDPHLPSRNALKVENNLESVESPDPNDPNSPSDTEPAYEVDRKNRSIKTAVAQAMYFDDSSTGVAGVEVVKYPRPSIKWDGRRTSLTASDFTPAESILGRSTTMARLAFAANMRAKHTRNLKSGHVDASKLGIRPAVNDPRLFKKKMTPSKRDYFVVIGIDCSYSNSFGDRMERSKRAAFGMIELLNRVGVKFAVYGHTGGASLDDLYASIDMPTLWMMEIKGADEPWSTKTRERLVALRPVAENFDGHTMEFYRKILDARTETDRVIMYFTDGAMPAANPTEEEEVLRVELNTCKKKGYKVLGVGIDTTSPEDYGLPTVAVRSDEDIAEVVKFLSKHLQEGN